MKPTRIGEYNVSAACPDCEGAIAIFDFRDANKEFGCVLQNESHIFQKKDFGRIHWKLLRCSCCGRAGLAKFHDNGPGGIALESFHPRFLTRTKLPAGIPEGVENEYREAEVCASVEAFRAASALFRSALEKILTANGYEKGNLQGRIDQAADDGVITAARKQKAHEDVRVLGNEVVHQDWRLVDEAEVEAAMHYVQRILEDFYDDRDSVVGILIGKNRIQHP
jgi:hypothetical protein